MPRKAGERGQNPFASHPHQLKSIWWPEMSQPSGGFSRSSQSCVNAGEQAGVSDAAHEPSLGAAPALAMPKARLDLGTWSTLGQWKMSLLWQGWHWMSCRVPPEPTQPIPCLWFLNCPAWLAHGQGMAALCQQRSVGLSHLLPAVPGVTGQGQPGSAACSSEPEQQRDPSGILSPGTSLS